MKPKSPKELMLEAFRKHGANPDNMTCNYMPPAVPNATVWMQTVSFTELPDHVEDFFCYDQDWIYSYEKYPEEKITIEPARGSKKKPQT